jgi:arsenate reductase
MDKVIFACVRNAGRSQMAAAFFNHLANPRLAHAVSAGTDPADRLHPVVVEVMQEAGIDMSGSRPRRLTVALARDAVLLVTMGCGDRCPFLPGVMVADWPLPDPKDRPIEEVRRIRDDVRARVGGLVASSGWTRDHRS